MTNHTKTTGREYLRVSIDRSGKARSVAEQHADNQQAATERGVTLRRKYEDNNVSASRYGTKTRDDFAILLADLRSGRFAADELWLWESSRGSRQVGEWVDLIDSCERAGVGIYVTTHSRLYDPANGRDRRSLLEDAVDSEYESSKVSVRARRAAAANAAEGKPHGPAPYGYRRLYDEQTRRLVKQEPHPEEAPVVRELFDRIRKGHSMRSIALDFERRGIATRARKKADDTVVPGKPFTAQHLRTVALSPHYAGLRVHQPATVTKNGKPVKVKPVKYSIDGAVKGIWEPLVSDETFYAVRAILTDPARKVKTHRPEGTTGIRTGRAVHLLSMIAKCAACESPLSVTYRSDGTRNGKQRPRREQYQCHRKGCVRVDKVELEDLAEAAILRYLTDPDVIDDIDAADGGDDELHRVRGDLAVARAELNELRDSVASGRLSVANLAAVGPGLEARVTDLEAHEKELSTPSKLRGLITPGKKARAEWKAAPMSTKREVARIVLSAEKGRLLTVVRRPRDAGPRHVPADQRVEWVGN